MSRDPEFDKARELINAFAARLLALNGGKKIPTPWAICLKSALTPGTQPVGRKHDPKPTKAVAKGLILAGDTVKGPRTKHHNPAKAKNRIAKEAGVSRRTVDRVMKGTLEYLRGEGAPPAAVREAICDAFAEIVMAELKAEESPQTSRRDPT